MRLPQTKTRKNESQSPGPLGRPPPTTTFFKRRIEGESSPKVANSAKGKDITNDSTSRMKERPPLLLPPVALFLELLIICTRNDFSECLCLMYKTRKHLT